ncbi:MAG: mismatch-specific DNA-glycosylase [Candidatus Manganitrophaceae bacterium]
MQSLPDILEADLDIVFVGINPGTTSARIGHYYARATNLFWPMLYESGLIPQMLKPEDDWKLVRFGIGLTDVVKRSSDSASELSQNEFEAGAIVVRNKIAMYRPRIVCFNGLTAFRALFRRNEGPGGKADRIGESRVFVLPSTSRRNVFYPRDKILFWFSELNRFRSRKTKSNVSVQSLSSL